MWQCLINLPCHACSDLFSFENLEYRYLNDTLILGKSIMLEVGVQVSYGLVQVTVIIVNAGNICLVYYI